MIYWFISYAERQCQPLNNTHLWGAISLLDKPNGIPCDLQPPVLSAKSPLKSPVKRRSGLFPRLHSSTDTPTDKHTRRLVMPPGWYHNYVAPHAPTSKYWLNPNVQKKDVRCVCMKMFASAEDCPNPHFVQRTRGLVWTFCRLLLQPSRVHTSPELPDIITLKSLQNRFSFVVIKEKLLWMHWVQYIIISYILQARNNIQPHHDTEIYIVHIC